MPRLSSTKGKRARMDVSVILPVVNEAENLRTLIPRLTTLFDRERLMYELVVVDGGSSDDTRETAESLGARVVAERRRGYAGATETGFAEARGDYVLTLDADQSHDPDFIVKMWRARTRGDIVIASRFCGRGQRDHTQRDVARDGHEAVITYSTFVRRATSWLLNVVLRRVLSMPVRDLSSGYRLYRRDVLANLELTSTNFEVLEEILVKACANGFSIVEVPFTYFPRGAGRSDAKLVSFGWKILRSFDTATENPQLARLGRLRRARLDSFPAALLAAPPPSHHRLMGARRASADVGCGSSSSAEPVRSTA